MTLASAHCADGPKPGARALMAWHLGTFGDVGASNDGIYNCRSQRGKGAPSVHGDGRALDPGCPAGAAWAQKEADLLVEYSAELGVQCVIFNRRIWSGAHPDAGWRPYDGVDPHDTHLHVELSRKAGQGLTVARIVAVLNPHLEDAMTPADRKLISDGFAALRRDFDKRFDELDRVNKIQGVQLKEARDSLRKLMASSPDENATG